MTIRWKLNLSVVTLIAVFLGAAALSIWTVSKNAEQTRTYSRMRDSAQFTADLRTQIYQQLAMTSGLVRRGDGSGIQEWLSYAGEHVDIQIRLSESDRERELWEKIGAALRQFGASLAPGSERGGVDGVVRQAERDLQELRSYYDLTQSQSIVQTASTSLLAQAAIGLACVLALLLFLVYLVMVRRWLVTPVEILKNAAEVIGQGRLDYRVPLKGGDELAQLARRIDAMAESLASHQAALLQARELSALGELCANVAHGLRNPLAALRASAQLAEKRAAGSMEAQSLIRELAQQADRMDQRITRLFQFSRPMELRARHATFDELARAAQAQTYPLLKSRHVTLETLDRTGGAGFELDSEQLADAISELVTNAIHHSQDGTQVSLAGEVLASENGTGPRLSIRVRDSGAGMSPATLEKAFDLFFTSRPEGSGMGLALVRRFVERCHGEIRVSSERGAGTTVTIVLPVSVCEEAAPGGRLDQLSGPSASASDASSTASPGSG